MDIRTYYVAHFNIIMATVAHTMVTLEGTSDDRGVRVQGIHCYTIHNMTILTKCHFQE